MFRLTSSVAVAAIASLAMAGAASAQEIAESSPQAQSPEAVLQLFTPAALAKAKPTPIPVAGKGTPAALGSMPTTPAQPTEAGKGTIKNARTTGRKVKQPGGKRKRKTTAYFGQELPWSSYGYGQASPLNASGRLYFQLADGRSSFCSGTMVAANIVATAAHCVRNGTTGQFYKAWAFVPAQNGTSRPFGTWAARNATVPNTWTQAGLNNAPGTNNEGYFGTDYAFVTLYNDASGRSAGNYTGFYPVWANAPKGTVYHLGYPSEGNWNGCSATSCKPWSCNSPIQRYNQYKGGKYDLGFSCFTTGGASGGSILQKASNGYWYLTSVLSHMGVPKTNSVGTRYGHSFFGSYMDNTTIEVLNVAKTR